jgi:hypothetical protein
VRPCRSRFEPRFGFSRSVSPQARTKERLPPLSRARRRIQLRRRL